MEAVVHGYGPFPNQDLGYEHQLWLRLHHQFRSSVYRSLCINSNQSQHPEAVVWKIQLYGFEQRYKIRPSSSQTEDPMTAKYGGCILIMSQEETAVCFKTWSHVQVTNPTRHNQQSSEVSKGFYPLSADAHS